MFSDSALYYDVSEYDAIKDIFHDNYYYNKTKGDNTVKKDEGGTTTSRIVGGVKIQVPEYFARAVTAIIHSRKIFLATFLVLFEREKNAFKPDN